jgi:SH3/ankyrin repeat-containing protein
VNRLLEKGLDPNFHSDLGETPLTIAASLADPRSMIMTLYNGGAHLDFRSRDTLTPMHKAATIGNDKALKTLLELGAFAEVRDGRSLTPLFYSIMNASSVQAIEYLLFNGSSIGVRDDNNWQEIHHACKLGLSQHLDHLIYYGCDINAKNNSGNTPLHVCAIHNQENCARILLFRGCSRTERNLANQTAFESGVIAGNQLIADLIKNHRDCDIVPIRDRPFYNTKRRSIYSATVADSQSSYSLNINGSISSSVSSRLPSNTSNNKSTLSSLTTTQTLVDWNNNNASTSSLSSSATAIRSRSMPKLIDEVQATSDGGSSSPTSRSRSISSDDHGFGSASLSQMSSGGSPNNNNNQVEFAGGHRKRLYSSIPQRFFVCVKAFRTSHAGEVELRRNDLVEVFSVGDSGYWEGRCLRTGGEGWFRSECVEEVDDEERARLEMVAKRRQFMELIQSCDLSALRTVVLQRGRKGFGFVLRGAKSK